MTAAPLDQPVAAEPIVEVRNLSKRYGRTLALDDISLSIGNREMFALLGPNGAGKTTLLHILCTILRPDGGAAIIAGSDVVRQPVRARRNLGVVFQEPSLDDRLTAEENLDFHGLVYQVGRAERKARITEMLELVELADWRHKPVRSFSTGMKRRLEIGRALLHNPRIVFLDEPTAGLDPLMEQEFVEQIRRERDGGATVLLSSHIMSEVEKLCDYVTIIRDGRTVESGSMADLKHLSTHDIAARVSRETPALKALADATIKGGQVHITAARQDVPRILRIILEAGGEDITATPASLEEMFLSHYGGGKRAKG